MSETPSWDDSGERRPAADPETEALVEDSGLVPGPRHIRGGRDLTSGPIFGTLVLFTLPTLASNILHTLNGSINSIWVAHFLGEAALAATANANIIMFLMFSLIFGFGMAANVVVGQAFGRGDLRAARHAFGSAIGFCLGMAFVIAIGGFLWSDRILAMLSTPPEVFRLARAYLHFVFLGLPGAMMFVMLMMGLRGSGDSMTPLWFMILTVLLDILLNPVFILGLGPAPEMGIAGSAFATAVANYGGLSAMIAYIYWRDLPLRLRGAEWGYLKPDWALLRIVAGRGVPMGLQMVIFSLSTLVVIGFVNREGTTTVAAFAAAQQLWNYIQMPAMAVGGAVSAIAAQNIGAGKWDRVERTTLVAVGVNLAMTGSLIMLVMLFTRPILALFLEGGGNAIEIGRHMMNIVNWSFLLFSVTTVMFGTMRANGVVLAPLFILTFSLFLVRIGFYFASYPYLGADGLWWSFNASAAVSLMLGWAYYRWARWREASLGVPGSAPVHSAG
ncbi:MULTISPECIES: MATE family efflux transporter [unclassified Sphingobium]|uniref:MATE family efflux transporter n=1 Tax=unclassified Sphingobium TaxID=2611147 RepID=UPI002225361C|nr:MULTISPECIES: MATE family efflux transporter [unclassified Sphingobium]MCW2381036.1 putative MATE family efflux protein [Sphingobium sp. B2D3B]MCW2398857.1 putative MATE family efflux protein [Sphingobium sp. B2D3C]